jgi:glycosyltransferase involved in cell wall biosynthesis
MIFKNSYINVSPSKYLYHEFSKSGYDTIYIPNAISMRLYPFTLRSAFTPKLLWVRAFDEIYNPKMAVEVLFELKKKYKNAALCMVGPDKDGSFQEVIDLAKTKNVADSIEFTGLLTKQEWIKKSKNYSFFINTTNFDNMPVSIIEAMALGLPVISTNVGGMPYLIEDSVTGKLVAKNNVLQMTNTIESIIENPSLGVEITKNAKQQVTHFDEAIVKKMWLNLLK